MEIYKYFLFKTYSFAKKDEYNSSPEYSALFFVSQSIIVNLFTILNFAETAIMANFYLLIGGVIFVITILLNYLFFIRNNKFSTLKYKNNTLKNIVILIYLVATYYLFFQSL